MLMFARLRQILTDSGSEEAPLWVLPTSLISKNNDSSSHDEENHIKENIVNTNLRLVILSHNH